MYCFFDLSCQVSTGAAAVSGNECIFQSPPSPSFVFVLKHLFQIKYTTPSLWRSIINYYFKKYTLKEILTCNAVYLRMLKLTTACSLTRGKWGLAAYKPPGMSSLSVTAWDSFWVGYPEMDQTGIRTSAVVRGINSLQMLILSPLFFNGAKD